ncbi:MAG: hypothetical protein ACOC8N_03480 [Spirochaetota bacterium]
MLVKKTFSLVNNLTMAVCGAACTVVVPKRNPLLARAETLCRRMIGSWPQVRKEIAARLPRPALPLRRSPFHSRYRSVTRPMKEHYRLLRKHR